MKWPIPSKRKAEVSSGDMAAKKYPPGKHKSPRIILSEGIKGEFDRWRILAKDVKGGLSEWIREAARAAERRQK